MCIILCPESHIPSDTDSNVNGSYLPPNHSFQVQVEGTPKSVAPLLLSSTTLEALSIPLVHLFSLLILHALDW